LKKLLDLPVKYLYLGHYGIVGNPKQVIKRSIEKIQYLLDLGTRYMKEGKSEAIAPAVYDVIMKELIKLRKVRGEELYKYASGAHISTQAELYARFCRENFNK